MNDITLIAKAIKNLAERIKNFVTQDQLDEKADKTAIPDVSNFVTTKTYAEGLSNKADKPQDITITDAELKKEIEAIANSK